MRILGIDPGTSRIGYGLIESGADLKALDFGLLELSKIKSSSALLEIANSFSKLLNTTKPEAVSIEKIFFTKNQKTAISVAEARGVISLLVLQKGLPLYEYGPREVKQAVTSYGLADKRAVKKMVCQILSLTDIKGPDDVTDALAIAITAASRYKLDSRRES